MAASVVVGAVYIVFTFIMVVVDDGLRYILVIICLNTPFKVVVSGGFRLLYSHYKFNTAFICGCCGGLRRYISILMFEYNAFYEHYEQTTWFSANISILK